MGKNKNYLGFDIGGTGIKAALINVEQGKLVTEKLRELTPQPSDPKSVVQVMKQMLKKFDYDGPVGCGFPSIIHHGTAKTAANIDKKWIGINLEKLFSKEMGMPFYVANDADVAGLAEVRFGKANADGTVIVLTIGTGIGSGMFLDGKLIPNTEMGHLYFRDSIYERYISSVTRKREGLSWEEWGERFNGYLLHLEKLFSPSVFVLGGGASKKFDRYSEIFTCDAKVVPALYQNDAGVLGAAMYAESRL